MNLNPLKIGYHFVRCAVYKGKRAAIVLFVKVSLVKIARNKKIHLVLLFTTSEDIHNLGNFNSFLCMIGCYDDDDYETRMMECASCNGWVHARCEAVDAEKYQILSYLPDTVVYNCR